MSGGDGGNWRRSPFCAESSCVEVQFRRSSFCADSTCVEVVVEQREVRVRDSKNTLQAPLVFTADEWSAFVAGVKAGEFDIQEA